MKKAFQPVLLTMLIVAVLFLLARDHVDRMRDRFPEEQVYLQFTAPDGSKLARFSVRYESIFRWLSDFEPHYYVTVINLENGRGRRYDPDPFISFNMRENFLSLAKMHAPWCADAIESNSGPYLTLE